MFVYLCRNIFQHEDTILWRRDISFFLSTNLMSLNNYDCQTLCFMNITFFLRLYCIPNSFFLMSPSTIRASIARPYSLLLNGWFSLSLNPYNKSVYVYILSRSTPWSLAYLYEPQLSIRFGESGYYKYKISRFESAYFIF